MWCWPEPMARSLFLAVNTCIRPGGLWTSLTRSTLRIPIVQKRADGAGDTGRGTAIALAAALAPELLLGRDSAGERKKQCREALHYRRTSLSEVPGKWKGACLSSSQKAGWPAQIYILAYRRQLTCARKRLSCSPNEGNSPGYRPHVSRSAFLGEAAHTAS